MYVRVLLLPHMNSHTMFFFSRLCHCWCCCFAFIFITNIIVMYDYSNFNAVALEMSAPFTPSLCVYMNNTKYIYSNLVDFSTLNVYLLKVDKLSVWVCELVWYSSIIIQWVYVLYDAKFRQKPAASSTTTTTMTMNQKKTKKKNNQLGDDEVMNNNGIFWRCNFWCNGKIHPKFQFILSKTQNEIQFSHNEIYYKYNVVACNALYILFSSLAQQKKYYL